MLKNLRRLATASALAPEPADVTSTDLPALPAREDREPGIEAKVSKTVVSPSPRPGFPNWMLWLVILLWFIACVAGTFGSSLSSLPHEAFIQLDSEPVASCSDINPRAVQENSDVALQWCTPTKVLGESLPSDVTFAQGDIAWREVTWGNLAEVFGAPDMWLTLGLGLVAILFLVGFSKVTGTLRAGLAAAISVTFLGLLLFPLAFTSRLPADMRSELVTAWQWVIAFYFGSEAAVQAVKVIRPEGATAGGDVAGTGTVQTTVTNEVSTPAGVE